MPQHQACGGSEAHTHGGVLGPLDVGVGRSRAPGEAAVKQEERHGGHGAELRTHGTQGGTLLRAALRRAAFRLQARWRPESAPALIFCKGHLCGYSGEDIPGVFNGLKSWVCPFIPVQSPAEFSRLHTPRRLRATQEEEKKNSVARLPQKLEVFGPSLCPEQGPLAGERRRLVWGGSFLPGE